MEDSNLFFSQDNIFLLENLSKLNLKTDISKVTLKNSINLSLNLWKLRYMIREAVLIWYRKLLMFDVIHMEV